MSTPDANGWQPIDGWGGRYEIHPSGSVRTIDGKRVGLIVRADGYVCVRLSGGGKRDLVRLHRLVAQRFCSNPNCLPVVNHIDHDRSNNVFSNLEWCTQKQNLEHARRHGRMADSYWVGRRGPNAPLSDDAVRQCRNMRKQGLSLAEIAGRIGSNKKSVHRILRGQSYAHVA